MNFVVAQCLRASFACSLFAWRVNKRMSSQLACKQGRSIRLMGLGALSLSKVGSICAIHMCEWRRPHRSAATLLAFSLCSVDKAQLFHAKAPWAVQPAALRRRSKHPQLVDHAHIYKPHNHTLCKSALVVETRTQHRMAQARSHCAIMNSQQVNNRLRRLHLAPPPAAGRAGQPAPLHGAPAFQLPLQLSPGCCAC